MVVDVKGYSNHNQHSIENRLHLFLYVCLFVCLFDVSLDVMLFSVSP